MPGQGIKVAIFELNEDAGETVATGPGGVSCNRPDAVLDASWRERIIARLGETA